MLCADFNKYSVPKKRKAKLSAPVGEPFRTMFHEMRFHAIIILDKCDYL